MSDFFVVLGEHATQPRWLRYTDASQAQAANHETQASHGLSSWIVSNVVLHGRGLHDGTRSHVGIKQIRAGPWLRVRLGGDRNGQDAELAQAVAKTCRPSSPPRPTHAFNFMRDNASIKNEPSAMAEHQNGGENNYNFNLSGNPFKACKIHLRTKVREPNEH